MSLSTCEKCGGHIPLGPDATNKCEDCGEPIFKPFRAQGTRFLDAISIEDHNRSILAICSERDRYRKALLEISDACFGNLSKGEVENLAYYTAKNALEA